MIETSSKSITLKDFLDLPETKPAKEYIKGKIIQKPMPKGKHSTIQTELSTAINITLNQINMCYKYPKLSLHTISSTIKKLKEAPPNLDLQT